MSSLPPTSTRELESASNEADISAAVCVVPSKDTPVVPERLVAAALDKWGRLDGALIGVVPSPKGNALEVTDTEWSAAFQSVFLDAVGLIRGISRSVASGGSVMLVLSPNESEPLVNQAVANGLDAALASVAMQLAVELGPHGIRVNALVPGQTPSEGADLRDSAPGDAAQLVRHADPEGVGRLAAFVLSQAASYISGSIISVDGSDPVVL